MEFQFRKIDHVQLSAPIGGEEEARRFYSGILGLKEVEKPQPLRDRGGVWFNAGDINIHIGVEENFIPAKKAHPAIAVQNLTAMKKYLEEKNYNYENDYNLPGANRIYVHDSFGNRIEFLEWI
ncbi:VOC family protein [Ornithinibacillus halophilus]|uniref:Catechol 2,3-dioxygenase n=1 Tax=Ornithinibacillus halophilus TaxID=930117 RepID=A0A1M5HU39_9BACI|nr:VOC family protein [Ornithinibacillus halophilus]SHG19481.1 Catechol 2,3-dioxygenase [Ornithinibacillus halophilus]